MGIEVVTHKGKEVIYFDFQGQDEDQMVETLKEGARLAVKKGRQEGKILCMINVAETRYGLKFLNAAKEETKTYIPYVRKAAITGLTGLKGKILDMYNQNVELGGIRRFDTLEEAMDWLAK